jgi:DNA-binding IscR family transcriptional regulator
MWPHAPKRLFIESGKLPWSRCSLSKSPSRLMLLRVERMIDGEQAPVLCIEDEHQPKHDGEQPAVQVVFVALEGLAQKPLLSRSAAV